MSTPLHVALDIERLVAEARRRHTPIDLSASTADIFLRFLGSGCSRGQIAGALRDEAAAAGVAVR